MISMWAQDPGKSVINVEDTLLQSACYLIVRVTESFAPNALLSSILSTGFP